MKGHAINYSPAELAFIQKHRTLPRKTLHQRFVAKFTRPDIKQGALTALCKRKGWLTGRNGQFEKGHIPAPNAGLNGPNKTSFKKGQTPHNLRPIGAQRISKDGYVEVKTDSTTWQHLHIVNWRAAHGPIPAGHCISFIDDNKANPELHNLELINRNTLLQINRLQPNQYPAELQQTIKATGKLIAKTHEAKGTA